MPIQIRIGHKLKAKPPHVLPLTKEEPPKNFFGTRQLGAFQADVLRNSLLEVLHRWVVKTAYRKALINNVYFLKCHNFSGMKSFVYS